MRNDWGAGLQTGRGTQDQHRWSGSILDGSQGHWLSVILRIIGSGGTAEAMAAFGGTAEMSTASGGQQRQERVERAPVGWNLKVQDKRRPLPGRAQETRVQQWIPLSRALKVLWQMRGQLQAGLSSPVTYSCSHRQRAEPRNATGSWWLDLRRVVKRQQAEQHHTVEMQSTEGLHAVEEAAGSGEVALQWALVDQESWAARNPTRPEMWPQPAPSTSSSSFSQSGEQQRDGGLSGIEVWRVTARSGVPED